MSNINKCRATITSEKNDNQISKDQKSKLNILIFKWLTNISTKNARRTKNQNKIYS